MPNEKERITALEVIVPRIEKRLEWLEIKLLLGGIAGGTVAKYAPELVGIAKAMFQ